jgi:hypothetical protein
MKRNFILITTVIISFLCIQSMKPVPMYQRPWDLLIKENTKIKSINNIKTRVWDFKSIKQSQTFNTVLRLLKRVPKETLEKKDIAFWLNVYNIAALKQIVEQYPLRNLNDLGDYNSLQRRPIINLGGTYFSLFDIKEKLFISSDKRLLFALSDGVISSPSIHQKSFALETLDAQLNFQVLSFLSNKGKGVSYRNKNKEMHISQLFNNQGLFKTDTEIISFILDNTDVHFENTTIFFKPFKSEISDY